MYKITGTYYQKDGNAIVTTLKIEGHANSGNATLDKKVCAVISTFTNMLKDISQNVVKLEKGLFIYDKKNIENQYVDYIIYTFVIMIEYLYINFPQLFTSVSIYEKGNC